MKENINLNNFLQLYPVFKEARLHGRYITWPHLEPLMKELEAQFQIEQIGRSFLGVPVKSIRIGNGPVKVMGWSQMHGNESTTTKGLFDLFKLFITYSDSSAVQDLLSSCTFLFIPMLNPDGAARYTRENVNKVDLNRDAHERKEPESRILRKIFEDFQPDYCVNLHDQRTIFGAGKERKPATLSFLAPALDEEKSVPEHRLKAMQIISAMNEALQQVIPGQVGRYGDDFNIHCTGDTFQSLEVPTILFEAGHYKEDYSREETRKYFAFALFEALHSISKEDFSGFGIENYEAIPINEKNYFDVVLRNAVISGELTDVGIQFQEKMISGEIHFIPVVQVKQPDISCYGHKEIACGGEKVSTTEGEDINENDLVESILLKKEKLSIKSQENP